MVWKLFVEHCNWTLLKPEGHEKCHVWYEYMPEVDSNKKKLH